MSDLEFNTNDSEYTFLENQDVIEITESDDNLILTENSSNSNNINIDITNDNTEDITFVEESLETSINTEDDSSIIIEINDLDVIKSFITLSDTPAYYDEGKFFKVEDNKLVYTDIDWTDIQGDILENTSLKEALNNKVDNGTVYSKTEIDETVSQLDTSISNIKLVLPNDASVTNKLIDKNYATNTYATKGQIEPIQNSIDDLKEEVEDLSNNKQDKINDLSIIRAGAEKGATALQVETDPIYTTDKPNIALKSEIPKKTSELENNSGFITNEYHDNTKQDIINDLDNIRTNSSAGKSAKDTIDTYGNIVTHNIEEVLSVDTKYGKTLDLTLDTTTYILTLTLKDQNGNALSTKTVDFPIESVVVDGHYDSENKTIVLVLKNGSSIDVPVGDLVKGLQTEITETNKLSADLVDDNSTTNKFVTSTDKDNWNNKQDTLVSGTTIKTINDETVLGSGNIEIDPSTLINVTYSELVDLKTNSQLKEGAFYRITDYVTTTNGNSANTDEPSRSAGHQFDIIIQALGTSNLSDIGTCALHEGDTYFSGQDLGGWQIWYDINNDTSKYAWAVTDGTGKGVIYRMIDEKRNDLPYDFKNIQFYRDKTNTRYAIITNCLISSDNYYYTFFYGNTDRSLYSNVHDNTMDVATYISSTGAYYLNNNLFAVWNVISSGVGCYNNILSADNYNNTYCYNFEYNTIGVLAYDNVIGEGCYRNAIDGYYYSNTIGKLNTNNTMTSNQIGKNFYSNTISNVKFQNNVIGINFSRNTISCNGVANNYFAGNFYLNTISGATFNFNRFEPSFHDNTINASSYAPYGCIFGSTITYLTIGDDFFGNTVGANSQYITFGDSVYYSEFGKQNRFLTVPAKTKNIVVANTFSGSSKTNYLDLTGGFTVNQTYPTHIEKDKDGRVICTYEKDGITIGKVKSSVTATEWTDLVPTIEVENWDD